MTPHKPFKVASISSNRLMDAAGLTPKERAAAVSLFQQKVEKVLGAEM